MKTTLKIGLVIAMVALCSNVSAQNLKLAHINLDELIVSMSEYDTAMVHMQKHVQGLQAEMEVMEVERNRKWDEYQKSQANLTDLVRQSRMEELNLIAQRIQTFQEQAQESMQQKQAEVMQPVQEKATKAIETVAKEQGVTYVLSGNPQILLFKAVGTLDLLPAVKAHLGIKK